LRYGQSAGTEFEPTPSPTPSAKAHGNNARLDAVKPISLVWEVYDLSGPFPVLLARRLVSKAHGALYLLPHDLSLAGGANASFTWSPDEEAAAYVAEAKDPRASDVESVWERLAGADEPAKGTEPWTKAMWEDDFGEQLRGFLRPRVFRITWQTDAESASAASPGRVTVEPAVSEEALTEASLQGVTSPVFVGPTDLVVTGLVEPGPEGQLGLVFCLNDRVHWLYRVTEESAVTRLTSDDTCHRTAAILDPSGTSVLSLATLATNACHNTCRAIHRVNLADGAVSTVTAVCTSADATDYFSGVYTWSWPARPFVRHPTTGQQVAVYQTICRNRATVHFAGHERDETPGWLWDQVRSVVPSVESLSLADTAPDHMIVLASSPLLRPVPVLISLREGGGVRCLAPAPAVEPSPGVVDVLEHGFFVSPRPDEQLPLALVVHGGPHSSRTASFASDLALLMAAGFCVAVPNYTGSIGFGIDYVEALPRQTGTLDVSDVYDLYDAVVARHPKSVDTSRVVLEGGSHGGFIGAHVAGSHHARIPNLRAVVLRNPVTNVAETALLSDIQDWSHAVVHGSTAALRSTASLAADLPAALADMHAASAYRLVDSVTVPVLLQLGSEDKRVPPASGLRYGRALAALGRAPTTTMWYTGNNHGLASTTDVRIEHLAHLLAWFLTYVH
jgi:acylaminoacyl-peptidase